MELEDFPEDIPPEFIKWLSEQKQHLSIFLIYDPQDPVAALIPGDLAQVLYMMYRHGRLLEWLGNEEYEDWDGWRRNGSLEDFLNYQKKLRT